MLHAEVGRAVDCYLERMDQALPNRLEGFYLVGSNALGAFRVGRSDIDFVAIVGSALSAAELGRVKDAQARLYRMAVIRSATHLPWRWPLVCNGVFVRWQDLEQSSETVVPIASHTSGRFTACKAFDVNPVTWETLATQAISLRGPEPRQLGVHRNAGELRRWTRANLDSYWRRWANDVSGTSRPAIKALVSHYVAWGVLGVARMQYTISTGQVASKPQAGAYALEVNATEWHPLIRETLRYWDGEHETIAYRSPVARRRDAARFATSVVEWASTHA